MDAPTKVDFLSWKKRKLTMCSCFYYLWANIDLSIRCINFSRYKIIFVSYSKNLLLFTFFFLVFQLQFETNNF